MKAIIIEDEPLAAHTLETLVRELEPGWEIAATLQSIEESVEWLNGHPAPDVAFMDIHLADGSSFAIFDEAEVKCPIIFTTAYDEYALKAFTVNSVDYLLKPINKPDLERALAKLKTLHPAPSHNEQQEIIHKLVEAMREKPAHYRSSLLVSEKDKLVPVAVKEIAYIYIDAGMVKAQTFGGRHYILDGPMEEVAQTLDPEAFYRANRQYIVARAAVRDISVWFGGKLAVNLAVPTPERIFVSRANAKEFKQWITG